MAVSRVTFFGLVLFCISDVHGDAGFSALAQQVRLVKGEIDAWKLKAVNDEITLNNRFQVLESSLKEELTESVIPPLIKPLVKHAIADILNDDYIGNIISGHVLNEVQSLKTNLRNTKTQLVAVTEDLRRVERERGIYRKSLRKLRRSLTKDIQAVQLHLNQEIRLKLPTDFHSLTTKLNQTNEDLLNTKQMVSCLTEDLVTLNISCGIKKDVKPREGNESSLASSSLSPLTASTTSYPETTAASTDRQDPSLSTTVPPMTMTTQDPDQRATPSAAAGRDLWHASRDGDLETVRRIVAAGRVDVNYRGGASTTPVMMAAYNGHRDVVKFLVDEGADLSLVDGNGDNILHWACWGGDLETVKLILSLDVVDVNARTNDGKTAADVARLGRHQRVLDLLVSRGGTLTSG